MRALLAGGAVLPCLYHISAALYFSGSSDPHSHLLASWAALASYFYSFFPKSSACVKVCYAEDTITDGYTEHFTVFPYLLPLWIGSHCCKYQHNISKMINIFIRQTFKNQHKCQKKIPLLSRLSERSPLLWPPGSTGHHHEGAGKIMEGCCMHCHSQHCSRLNNSTA